LDQPGRFQGAVSGAAHALSGIRLVDRGRICHAEDGRSIIMRMIRGFVLFECAAFTTAALTHCGVLVRGYEHLKAGTAESVIALVLLIGLILSLIRPQSTRAIGMAVQGFALLGTLVGIFTIAVGIGPRTIPDITYHIVIVAVLIWGLVKTWRARQSRQWRAGLRV
jgi:hypothetical protein